eukprot:SAG11_NODE_649_length_7940_cov_12.287973_5_plen_550_part_00
MAGLGILVTIPLLRTGTRSALAAEFEITLQIQLLERAMYRGGFAGKAGSGLVFTFGCLAAVNFWALCSRSTSARNCFTTAIASVGCLLAYLCTLSVYGCRFFGWSVHSEVVGQLGLLFMGQHSYTLTLPKLLADINSWSAGDHGQVWSQWELSNDVYPVWKASFQPQLVTQTVAPVNTEWHAQTLENSNSNGSVEVLNASAAVHAQNDAALAQGRPDGLVIGYCPDAIFTPWGAGNITCHHNPLKSAMMLRHLADGVTLVGWAPPFYAFQHHMINGLPQLNISVELLKKLALSPLFDHDSENLLCGSPANCDAARAAGVDARVKLIGGHGMGNQGHHVRHLVWAFSARLDQSERAHVATIEKQFAAYGYPPGAYRIADEYRTSLGGEARSERYILLISREHQRSRSLPAYTRDALIENLEATLLKDGYGTELRVFTDPNGLANDSALFYGAKAVIGLHGGACSNIVFCDQGTHVIEAQPTANPRLMFAGIAYSRGLVHHTFNSDHWPNAQWYSDETIDLDADRFHNFVVRTLSLADVINIRGVVEHSSG